MNCLTARKIILSKDVNPGDVDISMAGQHVNTCRDCHRILKQQNDFKRILRKKLAGRPAPTTLRENILSAIAAERVRKAPVRKRRTFQRRTSIAAGVAAVLLLLLVFIYLGFFKRETDYANPGVHALVQDHIASKLREHPLDLRTDDTAELKRWFAVRVNFSVHIPKLNDSTLLGGRLCVVNGERVVYLAFQSTDPDLSGKESAPLSMYITERNVIDLSKLRVIDASGRKKIFHGDAKGCNVIMWEEKGLIFSLVSDMNEEDLIQLAAKS